MQLMMVWLKISVIASEYFAVARSERLFAYKYRILGAFAVVRPGCVPDRTFDRTAFARCTKPKPQHNANIIAKPLINYLSAHEHIPEQVSCRRVLVVRS